MPAREPPVAAIECKAVAVGGGIGPVGTFDTAAVVAVVVLPLQPRGIVRHNPGRTARVRARYPLLVGTVVSRLIDRRLSGFKYRTVRHQECRENSGNAIFNMSVPFV